MLKQVLVLLVLATGCASQVTPSRYDSPIVAYPMNERILANGEVTKGLAKLVRSAGYGHRADEHAGFLVIDGDGHFRLVTWPASNRFHAQAWTGTIPEGTVAVAHTHPSELPSASGHDCDEARRLGIPIFVLTPESVVLIDARDGRPQSIASAGWLTAF